MQPSVNIILEQLPKYRGEKTMINPQQQTFDIIAEILKMHNRTTAHYDAIARHHKKPTPLETARHLFLFLKQNAPYTEEKTQAQTIKEPQAILSEALTFGNDCKHYASYINGVGAALCRMGYPIKCYYRFAGYDKTKTTPGHVFAVWIINGREFWIDPVPQIGGFDNRATKPAFYTDKPAPMSNTIGALYTVGAIDEMGRAKRTKRPHKKIQPGKFFKKIALAPNRNAFLLYLKLNLFHTGSKIYAKMQTNPAFKAKLYNLWNKIGGNTNKLTTALTQAAKVWNKHHPNRKIPMIGAQMVTTRTSQSKRITGGDEMGYLIEGYDPRQHQHTINRLSHAGGSYRARIFGPDEMGALNYAENYIGAAPLAVPAILAAAAPVIAAFSALLKSMGISHAKGGDTAGAEEKTISDHNEATDEKGDGKKDIQPDGSVDHGNGITTKVETDGSGRQVLTYGAKEGANAGEIEGGGGPASGGEMSTPTAGVQDNPAINFLTNTKNYIAAHKTAFIVGGAGVVALIFLPKIITAAKGAHKRTKK
jgi:hypothetical protein